jgi:RNA polymerase sigma-70 factor (ECF subfamily)
VKAKEAQASSLRDDLVGAIPNMRAFAISLCGNRDRADDLVQEALVKAWNHLDSFEQGTNLKAWLFTILRNAYFSELRKTKREVADADGQFAARLSVPAEQQGHLDLVDLNNALTKLPPDQREALILVGAEGFSYEDAANICGCAVGTVKSRVNRARVKLGELMSLDKDEDEPGEATQGEAAPRSPKPGSARLSAAREPRFRGQ